MKNGEVTVKNQKKSKKIKKNKKNKKNILLPTSMR